MGLICFRQDVGEGWFCTLTWPFLGLPPVTADRLGFYAIPRGSKYPIFEATEPTYCKLWFLEPPEASNHGYLYPLGLICSPIDDPDQKPSLEKI